MNFDPGKSILIFKDADELAKAFCSELEKIITSYNNHGFNIALSGGSTPLKIFKILSSEYKDKIDWKIVRIFWGDERCVPPESNESNYGTAKKLLIDKINIPGENIFRVKGENDPVGEAIRYSEIIKANIKTENNFPVGEAIRYSEIIKANIKTENNFPAFDLTMLGVGEDGHTASIFPNQLHLLNSVRICETALHPETKQNRITITGKVINNSKRIFILVNGKNKAEIIKRIMEDKNSGTLPAQNIEAKNGTLNWYLDQNAAQLLK
ncbi:MAG: 6-phosphogluconolactonase [Ignavibacteriaceae bacterium]